MGKVYETLRQSGPRSFGEDIAIVPFCPPAAVADEPQEEMHFIEVGGRRAVLEASPEVLASMVVPANKPRPAPRREEPVGAVGVRAAEPTNETTLRVVYRPLSPEATLPPPHLRFAPGLVAYHQPDSAPARQYQALAHTLGLPAVGDSRVLLFTAPASGSGATTVILNLAIALARQGKPRVAVVDANVVRPDVAAFLGLPDRPGLREVLLGTVLLGHALQESGQPNLSVLSLGGECGKGTRFAPESFGSLMGELRQRFDVILVDGPPAELTPDVVTLATVCDAVHAVVPQGQADAEPTNDFLRTLAQRRCPVRGQILTER